MSERFGGYYARDTHRGGLGGDYARERPLRFPKNYRRSDDRIAEEVCARLTDDDHIDATNIDLCVEKGVVTLSGTVSSRWAKRRQRMPRA